MPTHFYVVMTSALPGQAEAFHDWYDNQHLDDCLRMPEVHSARRFRLDHGLDAQAEAGPAPFDSLAIYEIHSDDPDAVGRALGARAGTELMPLTQAMDRSATVRAMAVAAGSRPE